MGKERIDTELRIEPRDDVVSFRHEAMATELVLFLGGVESGYARQVAKVFFDRVDELETKLSLYRESSDVTRVNLAKSGEAVPVSIEFIECLGVAAEASELTRGKFNVFQGAGAINAKGETPTYLANSKGIQIADTLIEVDRANRLARKVSGAGLLDLGGVGKGFALDLAMEEIEDWDVPVVMANFGGSTLLFKTNEGMSPWIGYIGERSMDGIRNLALSSSGSGFQEGHIIDPVTGKSGDRWVRSFSRSASAGLADALSTGALLMSFEELEKLSSDGAVGVAVESDEGVLGADSFVSGIG